MSVKKYPVLKYYIGTYYICLLMMLVYEAIFLWAVDDKALSF